MWAATHYELAEFHAFRDDGDPAANLELAIREYRESLRVYDREDCPDDWADVQFGLSCVYERRVLGDRDENLSLSLSLASDALEVCTPEEHPKKWTNIHCHIAFLHAVRLSVANSRCSEAERERHLRVALEHYNKALESAKRDAEPERWAYIQTRTGTVYSKQIPRHGIEAVERSLQHFRNAVEVFTAERHTGSYAWTKAEQGVALLRGQRHEEALGCFDEVIRLAQRLPPVEVAVALRHTGDALCGLGRQNEAVAVYQQSLALRDDDAGSWHNLGVTLQELGRDEEAAAAYRRASVLTAAKREGTPGPRGHVSCSHVQHPVLRRRRSGLQRCDEEVGQLGDSEPGLHSRRRGEPDQRG